MSDWPKEKSRRRMKDEDGAIPEVNARMKSAPESGYTKKGLHW
jgi:hypothetical protein